MRAKAILAIISVALVLLSATFLPRLDFAGNGFRLLQAEEEEEEEEETVVEIQILSRGFISGNPHYVPQNVTARVGTVVVWINGDTVHHTATNDEGIQGKLEGQIFDSGPIPPRSEFVLETSRLLDDVYAYHCTIHPWTKGMLTLVTQPISVSTDRSLYTMGDEVMVSGIASIPPGSADAAPTVPKKLQKEGRAISVSLQVLGPANKVFVSKDLPVLTGGKYSYSFTAGEPGRYTVKASLNSFTDSTVFRVAELPREKITVLGMKFEDKRGLSIATGEVGEILFIKTSLKNVLQARQDYAYIVQVRDAADQATVFLEWRNFSIGSLGLSSPAIAWIPEHEGTYIVEVFIWNGMDSPEPLFLDVESSEVTVLP